MPENWRKSSYSGGNNCVEIGRIGGRAAIRDTKAPDSARLTTTDTQWTDFLTAIKHGRFDG
ncbi:DUF397 domain-containing protein [Saccharopolyspora gregorii]|uniref:DUF397 domain-containing protein n=1 Tax=Saccharopolyspora gregorii TaxID=33914 RepID=A0ABP6RLY8_9PSEU|nr:DUF397 domain-containing protein [Saccharopolyspora gregorii]